MAEHLKLGEVSSTLWTPGILLAMMVVAGWMTESEADAVRDRIGYLVVPRYPSEMLAQVRSALEDVRAAEKS